MPSVVYGPVVRAPSYRCCWGADPNNGDVLLAGGQVTLSIRQRRQVSSGESFSAISIAETDFWVARAILPAEVS